MNNKELLEKGESAVKETLKYAKEHKGVVGIAVGAILGYVISLFFKSNKDE